MELAYRLIVQETPFIRQIRNNVITFITPVIEVDGREKQVDTYYFNKTRAEGDARLPLMYWGKYVAHDNNRDGMGQFLALTRHVTKVQIEWKPTVMHDLHEAQTYLYASTGTGPYNEALDPITVDEWWLLAKTDVMEMTKRGVPGVWTYGFYDGWTPELHVLHRPHAQRDRPVLRSAELRARQLRGPRRRHDDEPGVVPPESAAAVDQVGPAQQHQHPAVGRALRAQPRGEEPRALSRELLAEEQARHRGRARRARSTPGSSRRPSAARAKRPTRSTSCAARASRCIARRAPSRPAPWTSRPATTSSAATSRTARWPRCTSRVQNFAPRQPAPVRRHRLDVPVHAQHDAERRWPTRPSSTSR